MGFLNLAWQANTWLTAAWTLVFQSPSFPAELRRKMLASRM